MRARIEPINVAPLSATRHLLSRGPQEFLTDRARSSYLWLEAYVYVGRAAYVNLQSYAHEYSLYTDHVNLQSHAHKYNLSRSSGSNLNF